MTISYAEYEKTVPKTAAVDTKNFLYYFAGLVGEAQEFRDESTVDELGDVCWYYSMCNRCLDIKLDLDAISAETESGDTCFFTPSSLFEQTVEVLQLVNKLERKLTQEKPVRDLRIIIAGKMRLIGKMIVSFGAYRNAIFENRDKLLERLAKNAI